ncbi:hypothetical protein RN001_004496 [Aquatica leii]|uniref:Uncharacterized protein n=1 Tax=Aquatica leii TaxID=1421715 RepID=A0AAN7SHH4_9COLE|nr:hypothetical protein RN001_004496 [Aquatica leii]
MSGFIQGKTLRSQSRQMVVNLLVYFQQEKDNGGPLIPLTSVQERIKSEHKLNLVLSSPGKKRSRKKSKTVDLPASSKMTIRNTLYKMYTNRNMERSWQDDNLKSVRKPEGYDGKRFIVVHAGTKSGFVKNALLLFSSKSQHEDYHEDMKGETLKNGLWNV